MIMQELLVMNRAFSYILFVEYLSLSLGAIESIVEYKNGLIVD